MGSMDEHGQPPMAATGELLKFFSCQCKATVGVKLCAARGCDKYRCLTCVKTLILKHKLERVDDPEDNLTPFFIFATINVMES